ncbi:MAG: hypothetical protein HQL30_06165 [Candidatus Omnitrophica bacterium]|nr:hypothetical protein [Candidatus Omnitrophota bacterium]
MFYRLMKNTTLKAVCGIVVSALYLNMVLFESNSDALQVQLSFTRPEFTPLAQFKLALESIRALSGEWEKAIPRNVQDVDGFAKIKVFRMDTESAAISQESVGRIMSYFNLPIEMRSGEKDEARSFNLRASDFKFNWSDGKIDDIIISFMDGISCLRYTSLAKSLDARTFPENMELLPVTGEKVKGDIVRQYFVNRALLERTGTKIEAVLEKVTGQPEASTMIEAVDKARASSGETIAKEKETREALAVKDAVLATLIWALKLAGVISALMLFAAFSHMGDSETGVKAVKAAISFVTVGVPLAEARKWLKGMRRSLFSGKARKRTARGNSLTIERLESRQLLAVGAAGEYAAAVNGTGNFSQMPEGEGQLSWKYVYYGDGSVKIKYLDAGTDGDGNNYYEYDTKGRMVVIKRETEKTDQWELGEIAYKIDHSASKGGNEKIMTAYGERGMSAGSALRSYTYNINGQFFEKYLFDTGEKYTYIGDDRVILAKYSDKANAREPVNFTTYKINKANGAWDITTYLETSNNVLTVYEYDPSGVFTSARKEYADGVVEHYAPGTPWDTFWPLVSKEVPMYEFEKGFNLPWSNYGHDYGEKQTGEDWSISSDLHKFYEKMLRFSGASVRLFAFCDLRAGMNFDSNGMPVGFTYGVYRDFERALDTAQALGIKVTPVLFDHLLGLEPDPQKPGSWRKGGHADLIEDPVKRQALVDILRPFIARFNDHPALQGWDVMNEADIANWWSTQAGNPISTEKLFDFVRDMGVLVSDVNRTSASPRSDLTVTSGFSDRYKLKLFLEYLEGQGTAGQAFNLGAAHYYPDHETKGVPLAEFPDDLVALLSARPFVYNEIDPAGIAARLNVILNSGQLDRGVVSVYLWTDDSGNFNITDADIRVFKGWGMRAVDGDTDDNGEVTPGDVLFVVNFLNGNGVREAVGSWKRMDLNRDDFITAGDVLYVINIINNRSLAPNASAIYAGINGGVVVGEGEFRDQASWERPGIYVTNFIPAGAEEPGVRAGAPYLWAFATEVVTPGAATSVELEALKDRLFPDNRSELADMLFSDEARTEEVLHPYDATPEPFPSGTNDPVDAVMAEGADLTLVSALDAITGSVDVKSWKDGAVKVSGETGIAPVSAFVIAEFLGKCAAELLARGELNRDGKIGSYLYSEDDPVLNLMLDSKEKVLVRIPSGYLEALLAFAEKSGVDGLKDSIVGYLEDVNRNPNMLIEIYDNIAGDGMVSSERYRGFGLGKLYDKINSLDHNALSVLRGEKKRVINVFEGKEVLSNPDAEAMCDSLKGTVLLPLGDADKDPYGLIRSIAVGRKMIAYRMNKREDEGYLEQTAAIFNGFVVASGGRSGAMDLAGLKTIIGIKPAAVLLDVLISIARGLPGMDQYDLDQIKENFMLARKAELAL